MAKGNSQKKADGSALQIEAQLWADLHPDLKADFILANPLLYHLPDRIVTGIIQTIPLYGA